MRVLLVDDDRVNAVLFAEVCRLAGDIELECAESGQEALEMLSGVAPDLLVIDLHLPDTRGDRLLAELRGALARHVRAILYTAETEAEGQATAASAGFDRCWTKPLDVDQAIAELRRLAADTASAP